ncbi:MAG: RnfABCDGE type electron transport complex subunit A [Bacilli bacterium]|jgi:electron transport complex protein RnfA|nr:RnfABCDGE type electron transport complex subunit A [Bacilli bacterium]
MQVLSWLIGAILIQNVILSRFFGTCPFLGVSKSKDSAVGMGLAVTFVMTMAATVSWLLYKYVLVAFDLVYMKTIVFILVIASLVQIIEMFIKKFSPSLYRALGIYLPLITTNCAVLGLSTIVTDGTYTFLKAIIYSFGSGIGFLFIIYIFSILRQKMETSPIPEGFKGIPIALITACLMAMIIARFAGVA